MRRWLKNHISSFWPFWGYLAISLIFLSPILFQPGLPFKYDWNWPLYNLRDFLFGINNLGNLGIASAFSKYGPLLLSLFGYLHLPPSLALWTTFASPPRTQNIQTIQQFNNNTAIFLSITDWATDYAYYKDGWSRGRYDFWRKNLFAELEQDFIYTTQTNAVLSGQIDQDGEYQLFVRYLDGGVAGSFQLQISNSKFLISKNTGEEKFIVKDLGKISVKKGDKIEITNIFGENAIADLFVTK